MATFLLPRAAVVFSIVIALSMAQQDADEQEEPSSDCMLSAVFMHSVADESGNARAIDVLPHKDDPRFFLATMDYNMPGFDLEAFAEPADHCRARRLTESTMYVDPGSRVEAEVVIEKVDRSGQINGPSTYYTVEASRRNGSETTLSKLRVLAGAISPEFTPYRRSYQVTMDRMQEVVRISFSKVDSGQVVALESDQELPSENLEQTRRLVDGEEQDDDGSISIGEPMHPLQSKISTLDVGMTRVMRLTVSSADQAHKSKYVFVVTRPACPRELPFFDGKSGVCTDICNAGHFGNPSTGRCTPCGKAHCAVCTSLLQCDHCFESFSLSRDTCQRPATDDPDELQALTRTLPLQRIAVGLAATALAVGAGCLVMMCSPMSLRHKPPDSDDEMLLHPDTYGPDSPYGDASRNW